MADGVAKKRAGGTEPRPIEGSHRAPDSQSPSGGSGASGGGDRPQNILFTAFEPSGDSHAAGVITELLKQAPNLRVYAWGGPKMEAAGAHIVEKTCNDGSMGLSAFSKIFAVRKEVGRIKRWVKQTRLLAHVAVDSPAANFPVAKIMRANSVRVVHLVAPQLWAWGAWRLGKLRRLTNLVLCLLPHEPEWFTSRDVPAKFIGHPSINRELDSAALLQQAHNMPQGAPRVVILPGSRSQEVKANIRLLVAAYTELQSRYNGMGGVIVAANAEMAKLVRKKVHVFPTGLHMTTGNTEAAIAWCDLALAVSGTVTLDIARQRKPMIGVYKSGWLSWLGSKLLLRTPFCLLPNIVADREVVPEFVPHPGGANPIIREATRILHDSKRAATLSEELHRVCLRFGHHDPAAEAAQWILKVVKDGVVA